MKDLIAKVRKVMDKHGVDAGSAVLTVSIASNLTPEQTDKLLVEMQKGKSWSSSMRGVSNAR